MMQMLLPVHRPLVPQQKLKSDAMWKEKTAQRSSLNSQLLFSLKCQTEEKQSQPIA